MPKSCPECGGRRIGTIPRTGIPQCESPKCGYIFKHIDKTEQDNLPVERRKRHTQAGTKAGLYS